MALVSLKQIGMTATGMLMICFTNTASANFYAGAFPYLTYLKVEGQHFSPLGAGFHLGYKITPRHSVDILYVVGLKEDNLNRLDLEVPSVIAGTYRFNFLPNKSFNANLILGFDQVTAKTSLNSVSQLEEKYNGFVYGLALSEGFKSMPELQITAELTNLYKGDSLNILGANIGVRYEF